VAFWWLGKWKLAKCHLTEYVQKICSNTLQSETQNSLLFIGTTSAFRRGNLLQWWNVWFSAPSSYCTRSLCVERNSTIEFTCQPPSQIWKRFIAITQ
jgi:hypothetical protein